MRNAASEVKPTYERGGALQSRTLWVLAASTVLGGLGVGAALSVGALLVAEVSGNESISGLASATFNAGAAIAGIPLARLAMRRGRRPAIVTGNITAMLGALVAILGSASGYWGILVLGLTMLGVASAVQLLARFSATDLAKPQQRARDLSLVVWSITIGAVIGPNLIGPGEKIGEFLGIPTPLAGVFVFVFVAQALAAVVTWFSLRPDPLLTARTLPPETGSIQLSDPNRTVQTVKPDKRAQIGVIVIIAISQAIMVGLMAMTPLHLVQHGGSNELVGLTLSLHIAGMYALAPVFGVLASRFGRLPVVYFGWAILLVSVILGYAAGPSHLVMQVSLTLLGLGWSAVTVAGAALITELTPSAERTKRQGQTDTFMSASGALAGVLSGLVFAGGGFQLLSMLAGILLLVSVVVSVDISLRYRRAMGLGV